MLPFQSDEVVIEPEVRKIVSKGELVWLLACHQSGDPGEEGAIH
jgi:hypothetical protein